MHLHEGGRDDLPRQAKLVLEPAAATLAAARGELFPEFIDFFLRLALHEQRDRFRELEVRAAVKRDERLTLKPETTEIGLPLRFRSRVAVARDADDLGVLEERDVEVHGLFGVVIKP